MRRGGAGAGTGSGPSGAAPVQKRRQLQDAAVPGHSHSPVAAVALGHRTNWDIGTGGTVSRRRGARSIVVESTGVRLAPQGVDMVALQPMVRAEPANASAVVVATALPPVAKAPAPPTQTPAPQAQAPQAQAPALALSPAQVAAAQAATVQPGLSLVNTSLLLGTTSPPTVQAMLAPGYQTISVAAPTPAINASIIQANMTATGTSAKPEEASSGWKWATIAIPLVALSGLVTVYYYWRLQPSKKGLLSSTQTATTQARTSYRRTLQSAAYGRRSESEGHGSSNGHRSAGSAAGSTDREGGGGGPDAGTAAGPPRPAPGSYRDRRTKARSPSSGPGPQPSEPQPQGPAPALRQATFEGL